MGPARRPRTARLVSRAALCAAVLVHAGAIGLLALVPPAASPAITMPHDEIALALEAEPSAASIRPAPISPVAMTPPALAAPETRLDRISQPAHSSLPIARPIDLPSTSPTTPAPTTDSQSALTQSLPRDSASTDWSPTITRQPPDLGLNGTALRMPHQNDAANDLPSPSARVTASLRAALAAHDLEHGLGASGPVVETIRDQARTIGTASIASLEVVSDNEGRVTSVSILSTNGANDAWARVAKDALSALASKRVRVIPGSRGARSVLRVSVALEKPAGPASAPLPGAVPDDVPGADRVCEGKGSRASA